MIFPSLKFQKKNQNSKPSMLLKWYILTYRNQPKLISRKISTAEKLLNFYTVAHPKSKIPIWLPRSVFGGYHFWFGCCLVDLNLTEITMETSGSLFPFLIWQRHYVFKNTRGCLLAHLLLQNIPKPLAWYSAQNINSLNKIA